MDAAAAAVLPGVPTVLAAGAFLLAFYAAARALEPARAPSAPVEPVRRARAWYLTLPISFLFGFVLGPWYMYQTVAALRAGAPAVVAFLSTESVAGRAGACAMVAFMLLDLIVGLHQYREQIKLSTGYIHHAIYLTIYITLIHLRGTQYLLAGACCEMPTFLMALGTVAPAARADLAFGATFFVTRIAWFALLLYIYARPEYNSFLSWPLYAPILVGAISMHVWWFVAWGNGMRRRAAKKLSSA